VIVKLSDYSQSTLYHRTLCALKGELNMTKYKVKVGGSFVLLITLIINLFCAAVMQAQNTTNKPQTNGAITQSTAYCLPAVQGALSQAFSPGYVIYEKESVQADFLSKYFGVRDTEWPESLKRDGVLDCTSGTAAEVTRWLAKKGFNMKLSGDQAIGSVFNLKLDWQTPGEATKVEVNGILYSAAKMSLASGAVFAKKPTKEVPGFSGPTFFIPTTNNRFEVSLMVYQGSSDELKLIESCKRLHESTWSNEAGVEEGLLVFPKVSMTKQVDVSVLKGLRGQKDGRPFQIDDAMKVAKFDLTERGLQASAAVAFMTRGFSSEYRIDKPFVVMIRDKKHNFFSLLSSHSVRQIAG
jgi:hypothetical protein